MPTVAVLRLFSKEPVDRLKFTYLQARSAYSSLTFAFLFPPQMRLSQSLAHA